MRRQRGDCGADTLQPSLSVVKTDRALPYIRPAAWLSEPATGAVAADVSWCPAALIQQTIPLIEIYRRHRDGIAPLWQVYGKPSTDALSVIEEFGRAEAAARLAAAKVKTDRDDLRGGR